MSTLIRKINNSRFIKFCIIGGINTVIHLFIYNALLLFISRVMVSHTIAFILSSIFSYWANTIFTYQEKIAKRTFMLAMLSFLVKLILNALLAEGFDILFNWLNLVIFINVIPLFITAILLPVQFIVFNKIFVNKIGDDINETSNEI